MSYIRCFHSPEGLYIWADTEGYVNITHCLKKPLSNFFNFASPEGTLKIPRKLFHDGVKAYDKHHQYNKNELSLYIYHVFIKTGKLATNKKLLDKRKSAYFVKLQYKNKFLFMWEVTWAYVVRNVLDRGGT